MPSTAPSESELRSFPFGGVRECARVCASVRESELRSFPFGAVRGCCWERNETLSFGISKNKTFDFAFYDGAFKRTYPPPINWEVEVILISKKRA